MIYIERMEHPVNKSIIMIIIMIKKNVRFFIYPHKQLQILQKQNYKDNIMGSKFKLSTPWLSH